MENGKSALIRSSTVSAITCPGCGSVNDGLTGVKVRESREVPTREEIEDLTPTRVSVIVCAYCGVAFRQLEIGARLLTQEEFDELDPYVKRLIGEMPLLHRGRVVPGARS